ncbi:MAG: sensor histidine kinase [Segetibacter sp.]|nr:sensor histidine kinase [Segetibacter sp.]
MKLLTKYNRANIITAIIILLASSVTYYFIIRTILLQQLDKDLKVEEQEIYEYVKQNNALPNASAYKGQEIKFEVAKPGDITRHIKTAEVFNAHNENKPVRVLTFPIHVNGILYKAIVIKSQVEAEDLLEVIVLVTGGIILLMLIIISLINRFVLSKLWQPFYNTLSQLRTFDIKNARALELPVSNLEEFNELNASVSVMTKRINEEFETLKTFTENASHEMQTPLAIITSKLDILLQTSDEKQAEQLQAIYNATGRLTRLNQTLLLLTKINNDQYKSQNHINLKKLLQQKLQQFDELIKSRNIELTYNLEEVYININEELAEILMNNLLSNAIKHNFEGGCINCHLNQKKLSISNSGPSLTFDKTNIFQRFQRSSHSTGTGLGLAVVQQICESSGLSIEYETNNGEHTFTILI